MAAGRTYEEKMTETLISACTCLFDEMRRSGKKSVYCGAPPELLVLHVGEYKPNDKPAAKKITKPGARAYTYANRELEQAPLSRKRSTRKRGVYYEEAYAEAAYDGAGKAYITMDYGPRYASGYVYDIIDDGEDLWLANEQLLWVS